MKLLKLMGWRTRRVVAFLAMWTVLAFGWDLIAHELTAHVEGTPVRLVSATETIDFTGTEMKPFVHATVRDGALRLVVRTWFYHSGDLSRPYLIVDERRQGVLHVGVKHTFSLFSTKCEFLRQFEVEIPRDRWTQLQSLAIYSDDTDEWAVHPMSVADGAYMRKWLAESEQQVALREVASQHGGC